MDEFLSLVAIGALISVALTVPAGFGLSTILNPLVLAIMPPYEAVACCTYRKRYPRYPGLLAKSTLVPRSRELLEAVP